MFTLTTELAFRALLVLVHGVETQPASPRKISAHLECSPTYLSKTLGLLVKAGILTSSKGALGGVSLARGANEITMLDVVQACEGELKTRHCPMRTGRAVSCSFHQAVAEIHSHTIKVLSSYTLADLAGRSRKLWSSSSGCRLAFLSTNSPAASSLPKEGSHP
jgi:Rrf2 family protein